MSDNQSDVGGVIVTGLLAALALVGQGAPAPMPSATPAPPETPPLTGVASWYGTGPGRGDAAAGPALRKALGKKWRGTKVRVCADGRCVRVTLSDWCQCFFKQPTERLLDLSDEDFARLAPLSRGLMKVSVRR